MTTTPPDDDLPRVHARAHEAVIEACLAFAEALTTLDLARARAAWEAFLARFGAHADVEEGLVFPAATGLELPPKADLAMLARDHALLRQVISDLAALLDLLDATRPEARRALLVRHLDPVVRLHRALEHHGEREDRLFYPRAAALLPPEVSRALVAAFHASAADAG
ncbi:MAG: hypothetical protein IT385_23145 [Deltaproteobacteria bacterium]|nr:hypothetical protein [Deltaproteobacteria bacterium]